MLSSDIEKKKTLKELIESNLDTHSLTMEYTK